MAKYLITGGAGFIGANLIKNLLDNGHEVVVVDNFAGGKKSDRIIKGAKYFNEDVRHLNKLVKICAKGFDGIFHLAALPRVSYSVEHPDETHDVNVTGTLNILIAAQKNKIRRVIFSSSAAVYGEIETDKLVETMTPAPVSPYGYHKLMSEQYCKLYSLMYGVQTVCLRYFNVYGPHFDPAGAYALVVGKFIDQRKNNKSLTICGDGEYYRDYVNVADVVNANILAMKSTDLGSGEIINIGTGQSRSVNELAKVIGGHTETIAARKGDPRRSEANIDRATLMLKWAPKVKFEDGLKELKELHGLK
ncbi:MAG: NAD-dependent epimerase/dehydratase family protein [Patescibacteria group bacterium]